MSHGFHILVPFWKTTQVYLVQYCFPFLFISFFFLDYQYAPSHHTKSHTFPLTYSLDSDLNYLWRLRYCTSSILSATIQTGRLIYACSFDLSKALGLVSYELLWRKMRTDTSVPSEVINIFDYKYKNQVNVVKWAGSRPVHRWVQYEVRSGTVRNNLSIYYWTSRETQQSLGGLLHRWQVYR